MVHDITIEIAYENVLDFSTDVLVLKYAQASFGADKQIVERLYEQGVSLRHVLPAPTQGLIVDTHRCLFTRKTVFIGVPSLNELWYPELEALGNHAISLVATQLPDARHIAMTTHGAGFGLDGRHSFEHLLNGIINAIQDGLVSAELQRISIIEHQLEIAIELSEILEETVRRGILLMNEHGLTRLRIETN